MKNSQKTACLDLKGQRWEALHVQYISSLSCFVPNMKSHQMQLHQRMQRPEQVLLRRASRCVSEPAGALLRVCFSVCCCATRIEILQHSCFSEKDTQNSLWLLGLESCFTAENKEPAAWNSECASFSAKRNLTVGPLRHRDAGFVVIKCIHSGLLCRIKHEAKTVWYESCFQTFGFLSVFPLSGGV